MQSIILFNLLVVDPKPGETISRPSLKGTTGKPSLKGITGSARLKAIKAVTSSAANTNLNSRYNRFGGKIRTNSAQFLGNKIIKASAQFLGSGTDSAELQNNQDSDENTAPRA